MEIEYLREFLALAEEKSYLEAAESLYISQSSLSKHIKRLENEIGAPLFKRTTRSVTLTDVGMMLLPYAQEIVGQWDSFDNKLQNLKKNENKSLTVGSTSLMAVYGITEILTKFNTDNTNVKFNLIEGGGAELKHLLLEDRCDFAFIREYHWHPDDQFDGIVFNEDVLAAILPKTHPLAKMEFVTMDQIKGEDFILMQGQELIYDLCLQVFRETGIKPNIVFTGSNSSTIVEMVAQKRGIGLLMKQPALRTCETNPNVVIIEIAPPVKSDIVLIYRKSKKMNETEKLFLQNFKEMIK